MDVAAADGRIEYTPGWLPAAVPFTIDGKPERCNRYEPVDGGLDVDGEPCTTAMCFNSSSVQRCGGDFVFATEELTIVNAVSGGGDASRMLSENVSCIMVANN